MRKSDRDWIFYSITTKKGPPIVISPWTVYRPRMRFNRTIPGMLDDINKILSNETLSKFVSFRISVEIDFYPKALNIICVIICNNKCNIIM